MKNDRMHGKVKVLVAGVFCALASMAAVPAWAGAGVVTVYSADGLHDGKGSWYETEFAEFTKETGIKVQYVEGGSGGVVERLTKEKSNPQADVLVTLEHAQRLSAGDAPRSHTLVIGDIDALGALRQPVKRRAGQIEMPLIDQRPQ